MMRGLVAVEVMTPKAGPALTLLIGLLKLAVLVRLKNSPRTLTRCDSVIGIVLSMAISMLRWPGPRTRPELLFPKSVSPGPVAFGARGAEVNAAALRYVLKTREYVDPEVVGLTPPAS